MIPPVVKACFGIVALTLTSAVTTIAVQRFVELTHGDIERATDAAVERIRRLVADERRIARIEAQYRRDRAPMLAAAQWETYQAAYPVPAQ